MVLWFAFLSGCGGEGDPAIEYCQLLRLACERQVECGVVVMSQDATVDACASVCTPALALIADTPLLLRMDSISACEDAVSEASCETLANQHLAGLPECQTLHRGTLTEGAGCTFNAVGDMCADGLECSVTESGLCGTCVARPDSCVEGSCPTGDYCNFEGRCVGRRSLGQTCEQLPLMWNLWDSTCAEGSYCGWNQVNDHGPPHCWPQAGAGQTCSPVILTAYACEAGSVCVLGTCEPERQLGQSCSGFSDCRPGLACAGTCVVRLAEGNACPNWVGVCEPGLDCQGGTCATVSRDSHGPGQPSNNPVLEAGARCDSGPSICPLGTACGCSDSASCATMTCAPGPRLGESCAPTEVGGTVREDPFNPYTCSQGYCDFLGGHTCVEPHGAGGACDFDDLTVTLACTSLFCEHHQCRGIVDPTCL